MSGTYFIVVTNEKIEFITRDSDEADGYVEEKFLDEMSGVIEESGRDIDDLTPDECREFAFQAGYEGDYTYVEEVTVPDDYSDEDEFETSEGDTFTYGYLKEVLEEEC